MAGGVPSHLPPGSLAMFTATRCASSLLRGANDCGWYDAFCRI